jgi:hypothetical protein
MKTGTTFVQGQLARNRRVLRQHGVLYPMPWQRQVVAVRDVLGLQGGYVLGSPAGAWATLVSDVLAWDGPAAVLSMEFLSFADADEATRVVASFAPATVEVVVGARDVGRTLPAQWQTAVRNGRAVPFGRYLRQVTGAQPASARVARAVRDQVATRLGDPRSSAREHFGKRQDIPRIVEAWQQAGAAVTVVTVPPAGSDPGLLWVRMRQALGLADVELVVADPRNESLTPAAVELLRRVNATDRAAAMPSWVYQHAINRDLSHQVLPDLAGGGSLGVPRAYRPWCEAEAERQVARLRELAVAVIGDLEDLRPRFTGGAGPRLPEDTPDAELLALAIEALAGLADVTGSRDRARALGHTGADADEEPSPEDLDGGGDR